MCGIVGRWTIGRAAPRAIATAMQAIRHRGPDDAGNYEDADAGVALGHLRLAILDLSPAGHQPMFSADRQVVLVFNGEIYNFRELRAELEAGGATFAGHSDTEVLLALYLRDGIAMLSRLNGIFAFAIHDRRSGELLLARDRLGIKPLFYIEGHEGFAFASEMKALLPLLPLGALHLDAAAIHRYLTYLWCPGEGTPALEIRKLPPGQYLRVRAGRIAARETWFELPVRRGVSGRLRGATAATAVRDGLRAAVHRQLVADVPVGAFLSGGLDSSAIVAFAREQAPDLRCFTIAVPGGRDAGEADDLPYARRVAAHLGVALDVVEVDASRMAGDLGRMVAQLDEPLADPACLNVLYISELARAQGITVLLSGAGGDDLFTGYRRHQAVHYDALWGWLPAPLRARLARLASTGDQRTGLGRRLGRLFGNAAASGDEALAGYFAWAGSAQLRSLYAPAFAAAVADVQADGPMREFLAGIPAGPTRMERMLGLEQRFFLADHNLAYTDRMSMAAGIEVRVPFLDNDMVELAATIDDRERQRGRHGKWVLKQAMAGLLPHDVIHRAKTGFGAPLRRWIGGELRELASELLSAQVLAQRGLFDPAAVAQLRADTDAGRRDGAYTLLSLMCVELWCRTFLDAVPAAPPDLPARSMAGGEP